MFLQIAAAVLIASISFGIRLKIFYKFAENLKASDTFQNDGTVYAEISKYEFWVKTE